MFNLSTFVHYKEISLFGTYKKVKVVKFEKTQHVEEKQEDEKMDIVETIPDPKFFHCAPPEDIMIFADISNLGLVKGLVVWRKDVCSYGFFNENPRSYFIDFCGNTYNLKLILRWKYVKTPTPKPLTIERPPS